METNNTDHVRTLYNAAKETWPSDDPWHTYTHNYITQKVQSYLGTLHSEALVLNAGSGDTRYCTSATVYDVDIAEDKLKNSLHPFVSNIESLPFVDSFFDCVICVGSVLNYCDLYTALSQLIRVLKPGGVLCIEYERSQSAEFLLTENYNANVFSKIYTYNGQQHRLWLYSDSYVLQFLKQHHIDVINRDYFHGVSSLVARLTEDEPGASKFARRDRYFPWLLRFTAHNCLLWGQKI